MASSSTVTPTAPTYPASYSLNSDINTVYAVSSVASGVGQAVVIASPSVPLGTPVTNLSMAGVTPFKGTITQVWS